MCCSIYIYIIYIYSNTYTSITYIYIYILIVLHIAKHEAAQSAQYCNVAATAQRHHADVLPSLDSLWTTPLPGRTWRRTPRNTIIWMTRPQICLRNATCTAKCKEHLLCHVVSCCFSPLLVKVQNGRKINFQRIWKGLERCFWQYFAISFKIFRVILLCFPGYPGIYRNRPKKQPEMPSKMKEKARWDISRTLDPQLCIHIISLSSACDKSCKTV